MLDWRGTESTKDFEFVGRIKIFREIRIKKPLIAERIREVWLILQVFLILSSQKVIALSEKVMVSLK